MEILKAPGQFKMPKFYTPERLMEIAKTSTSNEIRRNAIERLISLKKSTDLHLSSITSYMTLSYVPKIVGIDDKGLHPIIPKSVIPPHLERWGFL